MRGEVVGGGGVRPFGFRHSLGRQVRRPGGLVVGGFTGGITVVTLLLLVPVATQAGEHTRFQQALFTATSAVCVTGLTVVDTPTHWSAFGQVTIMVGIQFGGLGFMTSASLLGLTVARRLGLRTRLLAAAETQAVSLGDIRRVLVAVALFAFGTEFVVGITATSGGRFMRARFTRSAPTTMPGSRSTRTTSSDSPRTRSSACLSRSPS